MTTEPGWQGYHRPDGSVGTRNLVLVVPGGIVPAEVCRWVPGTVTVTTADRGYGRTARDRETIARTLSGLALSPNVYGTVVWAGDPTRDYDELEPAGLAAAMAQGGKPVVVVDPDAHGGSFGGLGAAVAAARQLVRDASRLRRRPATLADLCLGVKCGNSDVTSGRAGNPVVGHVFDRVVAAGGTALFGETTEILGAEDELAARSAPEVAERLLAVVAAHRRLEARLDETIEQVNPIPANRAGGLRTLDQKSHGAVRKAGQAPLAGVLTYGERPSGPGLWFADTWMGSLSHQLGLNASGVTLCLYQLGSAFSDLLDRTSSLLAPLVWTSANVATAAALQGQLDFSAASVLDGDETVEQAGERLLELVLDVASGTLASSETLAPTDPQQLYLADPAF